MITLKQLKEKLDKNNEKYTDEQLAQIREFLIKMVELNIEIIKHKNKAHEKSSHNEQG